MRRVSRALWTWVAPVSLTSRSFLSSRRRHTRYWRDWSSDVCSSDLRPAPRNRHGGGLRGAAAGAGGGPGAGAAAAGEGPGRTGGAGGGRVLPAADGGAGAGVGRALWWERV